MEQLLNIKQLEFLTKLGMEEDTVEILGTQFTFKTLTVDENTQSFETPTREKYEDDIAKFNAMRIEVLSRAIVKVNNLVIPPDFKERMKEMLKRSQQLTLNKLFEVYQNLVNKQDKKFGVATENLNSQLPNNTVNMNTNAPTPPPNIPVPPPQIQVAVLPSPPADEPVDIVSPSNLMGPKK